MNAGVQRKFGRKFALLVALFVLMSASAVETGAEERISLREAARQLGADRVEEYIPAPILDGLALPTKDEWRRFWTGLQHGLRSGDLDELAWIQPEAARALLVLDNVKGGQPAADWLRQRMDYLEVANLVSRRIPAAPSSGLPVFTPPPVRGAIVPRRSPFPATVPDQVSRRRVTAVSSLDLWKEKLKDRPAPSRAAQLVPALKKIFQAEGVPSELVWQAEVESSFNPDARSPVGARGLYQFMPATGRSFGLNEGPPDDRLHPGKSAQAAARFLKKLYQRFHSWPLVLAAYNAGEGRVGRMLKEYQAATFSDVAPHLPAETRMYVPKVLATIYHREGIEPEDLGAPTGM